MAIRQIEVKDEQEKEIKVPVQVISDMDRIGQLTNLPILKPEDRSEILIHKRDKRPDTANS